MVTYQGTHIYCTASTHQDCETWLASLHAGLEANFSNAAAPELPPLLPPSPKIRGTRRPFCRSCGKAAIGEIALQGVPLPQYGRELRTNVCPLCAVAQGVLLDIQRLSNLYCIEMFEQNALETAYEQCHAVLLQKQQVDDPSSALLTLVRSPSFGVYRRTCPKVEEQCLLLLGGCSQVPAFLEALHNNFKEDEELGKLKKQAFRVAGDMGSAMKLLQDYCCPTDDKNGTDMLSYILEFFLDLCEEGELSSVAFFWPQLQCIHLRMLPPENAHDLARVDLMEDFLLTVATKYSVHLALELVWGYSADLEDSLMNANCSAPCKRRRFSVLRFVCELESLLFDFEHGWGGGSVALRNMVSPSPHQVTLLRLAFLQLQDCRQRKLACLSRSVRMDKLKYTKLSMPPNQASLEALRVARNADYFSSHLSFNRRLGDIAEKMRFMEVEMRAPSLQRELTLLNSSGGMGGDPLNRINTNLIRVVRVPKEEGHVFRSKERTPVLLLMELVEEGVDTPETSPSKSDPDFVEEVRKEEAKSLKDTANETRGRAHEEANGVGTDDSQSDDEEESESFSEESGIFETASKSNGEKAKESEAEAKSELNGIEETEDVVDEAVSECENVEKSECDRTEGSEQVVDVAKTEVNKEEENEGNVSQAKSGCTVDHKDSIYATPLATLDTEFGPSHHSPRGTSMRRIIAY